MLHKKYISVIAINDKNGNLIPISIIWDDYRGENTYIIDKILEVKKTSSKLGGGDIRYECIICGKKRKLFYEKNRWFVESLV